MDEWQNAIRYFLDRAAAVVIIVGQSQGVLWEVDQALKTVDPCRLLIGFPYSLSMARRPWWLPYARFVRNFHYSLSVLSVMTGDREGRYQTFRSRVMADMSLELPASPGDSVFIDFLSSRVPRLLPSRPHVLMVNSYRDELDVQPDYKRTVRPFVEKLLGRALTPSRLESIHTDRARWCGLAGGWLAPSSCCSSSRQFYAAPRSRYRPCGSFSAFRYLSHHGLISELF